MNFTSDFNLITASEVSFNGFSLNKSHFAVVRITNLTEEVKILQIDPLENKHRDSFEITYG